MRTRDLLPLPHSYGKAYPYDRIIAKRWICGAEPKRSGRHGGPLQTHQRVTVYSPGAAQKRLESVANPMPSPVPGTKANSRRRRGI